MPTLRISFDAGWQDDSIEVVVDGEQSVAVHDITTDYSIGLADTADVRVSRGVHVVEVHAASRGLRDTAEVEVAAEVWELRISREGDSLVFEDSEPIARF